MSWLSNADVSKSPWTSVNINSLNASILSDSTVILNPSPLPSPSVAVKTSPAV